MPQRVSDTPILRHNWAGNLEFNASRYHTPKTIQSVQAIVRESDKVHVVGARHSFSDIADTTGNLISLARLPKDVTIDHIRKTVTVNAGMTYAELGPLVLKAGYALPNMASLPHVSIAGACASATHGSGEGLGNLATAVEGLTMVDANGELVTLNRETEWFQGSIVSFGGLGAVTEISLRLVPAFCMQQEIYQGLPLGRNIF